MSYLSTKMKQVAKRAFLALDLRFGKKPLDKIQRELGTISFVSAVEDKDENIVKGEVSLFDDIDCDKTELFCVGIEGKALAPCVAFLGGDNVLEKSADEVARLVSFSVRLPKRTRNYRFVLRAKQGSRNLAYGVLGGMEYERLLEDSNKKMGTAQHDPHYRQWFERNKASAQQLSLQKEEVLPFMPLFSIVVPLYKTPPELLKDLVESVSNQSYGNWELLLVNASPEDGSLVEALKQVAKSEERIKLLSIAENGGISENSNYGIKQAKGDFVCFVDHDDVIEPDALFEYATALNDNDAYDLLYCDEDKLDRKGNPCDPFFKPDFDIDFLRSNNYVCHMLCIRKQLLDEIGLLDSTFDGAQDHDLTLRAVEKARAVCHVPRILYHWRICENSTAGDAASKPYASQAGIRAVQSHLEREGLPADVSAAERPFTYEVSYQTPVVEPLVSLLVVGGSKRDDSFRCIERIKENSTYQKYELIVVGNWGSDEIKKGRAKAKGEYLVFIDGSVEMRTSNWIELMLGACCRNEVGAVGARILNREGAVEHAGIRTVDSGVCFSHKGLAAGNDGYFGTGCLTQGVRAVSASCMMTKAKLFEEAEVIDNLGLQGFGVDYCLRLQSQGCTIVYLPQVIALSDPLQLNKTEERYLLDAWGNLFLEDDPSYNKNLSQTLPSACYFQLGEQ